MFPSAKSNLGWWEWVVSWFAPRAPEAPPGERLLAAARRGDARGARVLLAWGTLPDATRSGRQETALALAADAGHAEVAQALLAAGADPGVEDAAGDNALIRAAVGGHHQIIDLMAAYRPLVFRSWSAATALRRAALAGQSYSIRALLDGGTSPTARAPGYPSALFAAAATDASCVAELLDGGADLDEVDQYGQTPLHHAAAADEHECARLLVVAGANIEATDDAGCTALDLATSDLVRDVLRPPPLLADLNRAERIRGN